MIYFDRVFCNLCGQHMGQLFGVRECSTELADHTSPPYLCACDDCRDAEYYAAFDERDIEPIGHLGHIPSCEVLPC